MEKEFRITDFDITGRDNSGRVTEWEAGLPNAADLPPLSQFLISPDLASAFSITLEPYRSMIDVDQASRDTLSSLRSQSQHHLINNNNKLNDFRSVSDDREDETVDLTGEGSVSKKLRRVDSGDDGGGGGGEEGDDRLSKRIRLVWTPQLHKRFIEVVAHLGVKNAVPKTIMQLMNVEGLTRENVASHLQKYRLYVKRMQGVSGEGSSPSDSGGASENDNRHVPMPYPAPQIVPSSAGGGGGGAYHHGFEYRSQPYIMMMQPNDWSGNNLGSVSAYQHRVTPNHK